MEHYMKSVEDIYNRLLSDGRTKCIKLALSADKRLILIEIDDQMVISVDDDFISIGIKKKLFGKPYWSYKHTHSSSLDDLYEKIIYYLTCEGKFIIGENHV